MNLELALRALSSERRLQILDWLRNPRRHFPPQVDGDLIKDGVCGLLIARKLRVTQPTASEHLKISHQAVDVLQARRSTDQNHQERVPGQNLAASEKEPSRMQYRRFGRTGWNVSEIGYGMWGMAGWTGSQDAESIASLQRAVDLGCNFFDSAWAYGDGHSEQLLGKVLRANPGKKLYTATKVPPKNRKWPARREYALDD